MPLPELAEGPALSRPEPVEGSTAPSYSFLDTPVGNIGVIGGSAGILRVGWRLRTGAASAEPGDVVQTAIQQLQEYFAGARREFDLLLDLTTLEPTTRAVLTALQAIPYGTTVTYGELAERSGTGLPARAVGSVMGSNPIPLVIPCHRVVAGDGLGGYSGGEPGEGVRTKLWLLEHEGAFPPTLI